MEDLSCSLAENCREVIGPSTWRWPPGVENDSFPDTHYRAIVDVGCCGWHPFTSEVLQTYEDEIRFHHKSFIDYLLDPSRSSEYCVDLEKMNTRLALACIVTMQTFSLQPTSRIACRTFSLSFTYNILIPTPNAVTWGYATIYWTDHVAESRIPQRTLLQALMSFDLFSCYLDTLDPEEMDPEYRNTIKRVVFPSRLDIVISKIAEKL